MDRHALVRGALLTSDLVRLSHSCRAVGRDSARLRDLQLHFVRLLLQQSPNAPKVCAQLGSTIIGGVLLGACLGPHWAPFTRYQYHDGGGVDRHAPQGQTLAEVRSGQIIVSDDYMKNRSNEES